MLKSSILTFLFLLSFTTSATDHDETLIQSPLTESNEESIYSTSCRTRNHLRWDVCFNLNEDNIYKMKSFKFQNAGKNKIVPMEGFGIGRDFEFLFEGLARSDMGLLIWDSPDSVESHGHLKLMYFFPRYIMPAIRYESDADKDILIVTLPTKEEVVFNGKTLEILSGALAEGSIKQTSTGAATAPDVQYRGKGVVVEASSLADWPVAVNEEESASKIVSIKKKGQKTCLIPAKELWYTDTSKGGNVFFTKKLFSNAAFDAFTIKRCGFSIY